MPDNNHIPDSGKVNEPPKAGNTEPIKADPSGQEQPAPVKTEPPAVEDAAKTVPPPAAEKPPEDKKISGSTAEQPAPIREDMPKDKEAPAAGKDTPPREKKPPDKSLPENKQTAIPGMKAPAGKVMDFAAARAGAAKGEQTDKSPDTPKPRRGRKPKEAGKDKDTPAGKVRDKVSRDKRGKGALEQSSPGGGAAVAPTVEGGSPTGDTTPPSAAVEENTAPPRPVEDQKVVYLKISEMHPFHTYRQHPFSVRDDAKMQETVASIKLNGVMVPGLARPEKDGNGYEIIAGHRRCRGSELAGLDEMPFIVREMTDHEAVQAMKDSNKQRDGMLPMEMARLLDLEMEDIKHQGVALKNVPEGDIGKRSAEIVGEAHGMNYKKVMRYIRLNSLVPELQDMVDGTAVTANGEPVKKLGFIPAVELSYIRPKNQQLIAVSIEGEQATPSVSQAKKLRELDQSGKLTGDVIDAILSEEKKEVGQVIISTEELGKYFGQEFTPRQMKDQIIALLDEWKEKQPPEKKADLEK